MYVNTLKLLNILDNVCWGSKRIKISKILKDVEHVNETSEICRPHLIDTYDYRWHCRRVKYFINHPEEINEIEIDEYEICEYGIIGDGNHRFVASVYLGIEEIPCIYDGDIDFFEDELGGRL